MPSIPLYWVILLAMACLFIGATSGLAVACIVMANKNAGEVRPFRPREIQHRAQQSPWFAIFLFLTIYLVAGAIAPV